MAKKDERNVNIVIKNPDEEQREIVISLTTLINKLRKYLLIWIVTAVVFVGLAFGYSGVTTHVNKASLHALVGFSYDGIEKGIDPAGNTFDPYSIKNPAVIENALTSLGMNIEELENIRQGITIYGVTPKDAIRRLTVYSDVLDTNGSVTAAEKILETTYFPTQYHVYFNYSNTTFSDDEALEVINAILNQYNDYFYETYGYNESIGNAVTIIDYNDYDYSEAIDLFDSSLSILKSYVKKLANEDQTRFRSSATGYTFSDLYQAIDTVDTLDLDKISSYVTVNNLTKDKESALAYYEYRIKSLTRLKTQYEEEIKSYEASIASYEKDQILVFGAGSDDTNTQSTLASQQYDKMIDEKNQIVVSLAETKQNISYFKERQEALKSNSVGSSAKIEKVESDFASLNEKVNNLINLVADTSEDYYKNVTFKNAYNVLVPATNTSSDKVERVIENAKMPAIILEAIALVVYFAVAFIEAFITDSKRRKAMLAEAESSDKDDDDDEKSDK
ncbi:MAG: lipopolysaccharide biosynthesis protein [Ruminococcus flavefaciens]|nr:lipopolysaccharide biosynthesis protein [Ruminococcus flavefaciens]MCM1228772.1 lipopolysaccharide biosynthesis protein [Ruminococcus flavefaciens]